MQQTEDVKQKYHELIEALKTQRDELGLKMHLASMEVQDEWRVMEDKWQHLHSKMGQIEKEIGGSSKEVGKVVQELGEELKESYRRIRKLL